MAQIQHFSIDQGTTFTTDITVKDAAGAPLDLTDYSARCILRKNAASSVKYEIVATVTNPQTDGNVSLSLTPTESRAIKAGRYLYVLEVYSEDDVDVIRVIEGLITINPTMYVPEES